MKSVRPNQSPNSLIWWLLAAIGFFLPTQLGRHFFPSFAFIGGVRVDYLAPTFYFIDLLFLALIMAHQQVIGQLIRARWFQVLVLLLVVNSMFSQVPLLSLYWALRTIEMVWIGAIFVRLAREARSAFWIGSLVGGIGQMGIVVSQLWLQHSVGGALWFVGERPLSTSLPDIAKVTIAGVEYLRPYGTFSHPNSMGGLYALLAVGSWLFLPKTKLRFWLFGLCVALVMLSVSRGALAALAVGMGVWAYRRYEQKHRAKMGVLALILLGVGLVIFSRYILSDPLGSHKRIALLQQAGKLFVEHPIMGVGRGAYVSAQAGHDFGYSYFFAQPVHSTFILYVVEMGVVGFAWLTWHIWARRRLFVGVLPLLMVVVVSGAADHYWLTIVQNWHLMWIMGGVALGRTWRPQ